MMETLISMFIVSMFLPVMFFVLQSYFSMNRFPYEIQDGIGLAQLRRFLNGCPITSVTSHQLICYNNQEWSLRVSDHHLYLSDGTIIVLEGVNHVYFEVREKLVFLHYERFGKWKEALIGIF